MSESKDNLLDRVSASDDNLASTVPESESNLFGHLVKGSGGSKRRAKHALGSNKKLDPGLPGSLEEVLHLSSFDF
ncbi:hypothetical protein PoB_003172000 [Plakobranchus ocellatus]|uniref:Uncharacterized protein n=1 Tax=Plakobranchus ocellatus TaxID=259542 RepID=A0AAV4AAL4_9GAST|nr:hypothetical protein PoB_003172000 [Plakobranchus ocellatus]